MIILNDIFDILKGDGTWQNNYWRRIWKDDVGIRMKGVQYRVYFSHFLRGMEGLIGL